MILWIYLLMINIAAFTVWCADKYFAKTNRRRVPEKILFLWALLGGSLGSLCAMQLVRHKTKHWYFRIGIPLILFLQAAILVWILKKVV